MTHQFALIGPKKTTHSKACTSKVVLLLTTCSLSPPIQLHNARPSAVAVPSGEGVSAGCGAHQASPSSAARVALMPQRQLPKKLSPNMWLK